jgi:hypothetical protein
MNKGEENCENIIWQFVNVYENKLTYDLTVSTLAETYLHLIHHFLSRMVQPLLSLEIYSVSPTELNDIMVAVKSKLEHRITKKFFEATATKSI